MALVIGGDPNERQAVALGPRHHLICGIQAGVVMVLITNPFWLAKTRLQLQGAYEFTTHSASVDVTGGAAPSVQKGARYRVLIGELQWDARRPNLRRVW